MTLPLDVILIEMYKSAKKKKKNKNYIYIYLFQFICDQKYDSFTK